MLWELPLAMGSSGWMEDWREDGKMDDEGRHDKGLDGWVEGGWMDK